MIEAPSLMVVMEEEEQVSSAINSHRVNYKKDWNFNFGYSSHMTEDNDKLHNVSENKGR